MRIKQLASAAAIGLAAMLITSTGFSASQSDAESQTKKPMTQMAEKMPSAFFPETNHTFDPVVDGTRVTHDFIVQNKGDAPLNIIKIRTG